MADLQALTAAIEAGDRDHGGTRHGRGDRRGVGAPDDPGRDDRRHGDHRGALQRERDLRPRDAHQRARDEGERRRSSSRSSSRPRSSRRPTAVIGTIKGDLHDIGKNLVAMMWRGANIEVIDLGVDVPAERFVEAVRQHGASIVGVSALLTTTMIGMKDVVRRSAPRTSVDVKVVVGGAPVTAEFAAQIGADGYAPDAAVAVDLISRLAH